MANTLTTVGSEVVSGSPTTAKSRRLLYLDDSKLAVLREHRRRQNEERLAFGPAWRG